MRFHCKNYFIYRLRDRFIRNGPSACRTYYLKRISSMCASFYWR